MDIEEYLELSASLRERGIGVRVRTPFSATEPQAETLERYRDEATMRSNVEMLIALYLSENFQDFDRWMLSQAPMLGKTKDHHEWILARADSMRRMADQCKALDPAKTAATVYRNLLREVY